MLQAVEQAGTGLAVPLQESFASQRTTRAWGLRAPRAKERAEKEIVQRAIVRGAMCDELELRAMPISGTQVAPVARMLSPPSRRRRRGICPNRRASTLANHQCDRQVTQACKAEGTWSECAWLGSRHIHASAGADSQLRLPRIIRVCTSRTNQLSTSPRLADSFLHGVAPHTGDAHMHLKHARLPIPIQSLLEVQVLSTESFFSQGWSRQRRTAFSATRPSGGVKRSLNRAQP